MRRCRSWPGHWHASVGWRVQQQSSNDSTASGRKSLRVLMNEKYVVELTELFDKAADVNGKIQMFHASSSTS
eukprot:5005264-Pleurochrysis_carterae.AAC.5